MISVILLILSAILIAIGGICGFFRGILKQGVRTVLWVVLFAASLFAIPQLTDALVLFASSKLNLEVSGIEQLIELGLAKVDLLKDETALVLPLAGLARSLVVPVMTILLLWATGLVSFIVYLIVSLFLKKVTVNQTLILKVTGSVLGIVMFLLAGAITVFPFAAVNSAVKEGDYDLTLQKEFEEISLVTDAYEGSAVSKLYQYTGTEMLGEAVHTAVVSFNVDKDTNIWTEFPAIVRFGNEGWKIYSVVSGKAMDTYSMQNQVSQLLDTFFSLKFLSDENKIHLLKNVKSKMDDSLGDSMASEFLGWLEVQDRHQLTNDMAVFGKIYDILNRQGVLDAFLSENSMPHVEEETVNELVDTLYELSNSDVVVPEALKLLYASMLDNVEIPLELSDIEWTEETKAELTEVISTVYEISEIPENKDNITEEEKEEILDALRELEDNSVITEDLLQELINSYNAQ